MNLTVFLKVAYSGRCAKPTFVKLHIPRLFLVNLVEFFSRVAATTTDFFLITQEGQAQLAARGHRPYHRQGIVC
jgi:hypothetical protein